jgi:hypothetical protein
MDFLIHQFKTSSTGWEYLAMSRRGFSRFSRSSGVEYGNYLNPSIIWNVESLKGSDSTDDGTNLRLVPA